jgi:hypothetical protein
MKTKVPIPGIGVAGVGLAERYRAGGVYGLEVITGRHGKGVEHELGAARRQNKPEHQTGDS